MTTTDPDLDAVPGTDRPGLETRLAPVMFGLGFVYLLALAGLIHRATEPEATPAELRIMGWTLAALWPLFAVEAIVAALRRAPGVSLRTALLRAVLVVACPAARIGWIHPGTNQIWLPRAGWRSPGKPLRKALDRAFGAPMLVFAFLILPVLAGDIYLHESAHTLVPGFKTALHAATAGIWVAFAVELLIKAPAAPSTPGYLAERWLDVAIVVLPTLEFVLVYWVEAAPVLRLLRIGRALGPKQIGTMSRAYRLRGLMTKGWQAFLLLEGVARVTGYTPERRLRRVEARISDLEEELAELRSQADELRKLCATGPESPAAPPP